MEEGSGSLTFGEMVTPRDVAGAERFDASDLLRRGAVVLHINLRWLENRKETNFANQRTTGRGGAPGDVTQTHKTLFVTDRFAESREASSNPPWSERRSELLHRRVFQTGEREKTGRDPFNHLNHPLNPTWWARGGSIATTALCSFARTAFQNKQMGFCLVF